MYVHKARIYECLYERMYRMYRYKVGIWMEYIICINEYIIVCMCICIYVWMYILHVWMNLCIVYMHVLCMMNECIYYMHEWNYLLYVCINVCIIYICLCGMYICIYVWICARSLQLIVFPFSTKRDNYTVLCTFDFLFSSLAYSLMEFSNAQIDQGLSNGSQLD